MRRGLHLLLVLWSAAPAATAAAAAAAACPCADVSLCAPLDLPPRAEVFGFSTVRANWAHYPLDVLTTVADFAGALAADPSVICRAHAAKVKVTGNAPYPRDQLHNASFLAAFVAQQVAAVQAFFLDGINFDFEDPINATDGDAAALTAVIAATAAALRAEASPLVSVSVDVAWSPNCIDLRCYDYAGIAAAADLLFVMGYDMRSQVFWPAPCDASANAPLPLLLEGMGNWTGLELSVDPNKLVLGVPWYGYIYTCIDGTAPDAAYCPIERVTWRGVNCSDAVGSEHNYFEIADLLRRNATRPRVYNDTLQAPFFNFVDSADGVTRQVWYDDPLSLTVKYDAAKASGWRGVGMWNLDTVDYSSSDPLVQADTAAMWAAIAAFRSGGGGSSGGGSDGR